MHNINDFIGEFSRGFQRNNRYICQIFVRPEMLARIVLDAGTTPLNIPGLPSLPNFGAPDAVLTVPQIVTWLARGFLVQATKLPDRQFTPVDLAMYGFTESFPVHSQTGKLDCNFLVPHTAGIVSDNGVLRFFNYWQNQIQNGLDGPGSGYDFRFPSHYYGSAVITLLDAKNQGTVSYQFDRIYPILVMPVQMSWSSAQEFIQLPVQFEYSYWKILPQAESIAIAAISE